MKNLRKEVFALCLIMLSLSIMTVHAQVDKKLAKAETNFCNSINTFAQSLVTLDAINENSTMDEFKKAYKSADKAWNKLEKKAAKLEKVEMKESVKAYNKLVDAVNSIEGDVKTSEAAEQINQHIDATAAEISDILSVVCK